LLWWLLASSKRENLLSASRAQRISPRESVSLLQRRSRKKKKKPTRWGTSLLRTEARTLSSASQPAAPPLVELLLCIWKWIWDYTSLTPFSLSSYLLASPSPSLSLSLSLLYSYVYMVLFYHQRGRRRLVHRNSFSRRKRVNNNRVTQVTNATRAATCEETHTHTCNCEESCAVPDFILFFFLAQWKALVLPCP
jgi:hypothetical protein